MGDSLYSRRPTQPTAHLRSTMALSDQSPLRVPGLHHPQSPGPLLPADSDKAGPPRGMQDPHPLPWPCSAALSPPPDSPGPPPPSAGAEPFASLWGCRRRSTAPTAAAAGAAGGRGAAAGRRRGPGGAWRTAAPGRTELERRDPGDLCKAELKGLGDCLE